MNQLTLLHPDPAVIDNVAAVFVEGLGIARWVTGEDRWQREIWVPALGVWTTLADCKFILVLVPDDVSIRDLVGKIVAEKIDTLEYPFRKGLSLPCSGHFEALWGNCPAYGAVQANAHGRSH